MAFEILDQGSIKAAGRLVLGANAGASQCRAVGVVAAHLTGVGIMDLTLETPIGQDEFLSLQSRISAVDGTVVMEWTDATHIRVRTFNTAGAAVSGQVAFIFLRLGTDVAGVVAVS